MDRDDNAHRTNDPEASRPRGRMDDDRRRDPRERYGNEEDQYSRETRRAYQEQDLPRRMHDDRPYNRPGYEPEGGRPGGRENVELGRDRDRGRSDGDRGRYGGGDQPGSRFQGRYEDAGRYGSGGEPYGYDWEQPADNRGQAGQRIQRRPSEASGYGSGRPASPYDQGEIGSWYGGDTGMGESGSSLDRQPYERQPYERQSGNSGQQRQAGSFQQPRPHDRQRDHLEGPFTGRGPRGYQRSDERIREDVCELLTQHGEIDATSMDVDVQQGTVILRGMADSGRVRRLTEEVVEDVPGVRDVENQLRVNQRTGYADSSGADQGGPRASGTTGRQSGQHGQTQNIQTHSTPAYGIGVAETSGVSTRTGPGEPGVSAGGGPSQHGNRWQIRETMDVVGSDGEQVGTVKTVRGTDFQVDRPLSRDLYVPFSAVRTVDSERVLLSCRAAEVDQQNWPAVGLAGSAETPPAR